MENLLDIFKRNVYETLEERRMVDFGNGITYPKYGWAVVLAGSGGSGKGYALRQNLPIDGKALNVDKFKKLYNHYQANDSYNLADPRDTDKLHQIVRNKGWKDGQRDSIFQSQGETPYKSNIIFDITGRSYNELVDITGMAHDSGYQTMLVWIVCSEEIAIKRNKARARRVPDQILTQTRDQINEFLPDFIKTNAAKFFDMVYVIFSSDTGNNEIPDDLYDKSIPKSEKKSYNTTFKLIRQGDGYTFPNGIEQRLHDVLGV